MGETIDPEAPTSRMPSDLPPVEPPTGKEVVQLFLIPFFVVVVGVGAYLLIWTLFGKLAGGEQPALDYVQTIRTGNDKRRWRAAYELASLIHNDARLARDPRLLGELTDLLNQELNEPQADPAVQSYLALALGAFQTRDAEPASGRPLDPIAILARALNAKYAEQVRVSAAESLARQAARLRRTLEAPEAVAALTAAASQGDNPAGLRERATFALGFFAGDEATAALRAQLTAEDRAVRYNAASALTRRGDLRALDTLREMLTPRDLARFVRTESPSETQNKIEAIELEALRALQESISQGHPSLAESVRPQVADLTRSGLASVRTEAEALLKSLPESD